MLPSQPQLRGVPQQEAHHPCAGDSLGDHRGQGRALDAHVQQVDEDGVQDNVADRSDEDGPHAESCKALGGDKEVHPQGHHHKEGAAGVDAHIGQGVKDRLLTAAEEPQQPLAPDPKPRRQHRRRCHKAGKAVAHDLLCGGVVTLSHGDSGPGRAPLGDEHGKGADQVDHREAQPHPRQRHPPHHRHMADIDAVYNII